MGLSLPLVEFYTLGLAVAWLSLAAVVAPVQVATVLPLRQSGLDPSPIVSALPQVSRMVCRLLRSPYHPVLGLALAQECCLVSGLAPPVVEFGLDHSTQLFFCFSSPSWASSAWGLSWVLGSSPGLPSWVSSRVAAPWIHLLPHQVWVLGASLVVPLGLQVCLDPPLAL